jgi:hypothetical protein
MDDLQEHQAHHPDQQQGQGCMEKQGRRAPLELAQAEQRQEPQGAHGPL